MKPIGQGAKVSDTPRTDALVAEPISLEIKELGARLAYMTDHARQLERENKELLEALELAMPYLDMYCGLITPVEKARAAIAKARGT